MTTPLMKTIAKAVKQGLVGAKATESAVLVRETPGARTPGNLAGGTNPVPTSYACQGFESNEKHDKIGETVVDQTHKVICIVGETLSGIVPTSNDKVTIGGVTMPIVDLQGNPAMWTVLCRR